MEFKGTKVFPKYEGGDNTSIDLVFDNGSTITISRYNRYSDELSCSRTEMEANAKLISKAPEMLEALDLARIEIEALNKRCGFISSNVLDKIENLIKEATS